MSRSSNLIINSSRVDAGAFEPFRPSPRAPVPQHMKEPSTLSAAIADPDITVFQYRVSGKPYLYRREVVNGWTYSSAWVYPGLDCEWNYTWISADGLSADVLQQQFYRRDGCSVTPYILKAVPGFMLGQRKDKEDLISLTNDVQRSKSLSHQLAKRSKLTLPELSQREFAQMSWLPSEVACAHPRNLADLHGYSKDQKVGSWAGGRVCATCKSWTPSWAPNRRPFAKCHYCLQNLTTDLDEPHVVRNPSDLIEIEAITRGEEEAIGGVTLFGVGIGLGYYYAAAATANTILALRG